jgi:ferredoxin
MPTITVTDGPSFEAPADQRLTLALEDNGIDILHRCGGYAKCTTCRVNIVDNEPEKMTVAEKERLEQGNLLGEVRLSCQILCDHDMTVEPLMRLSNTDLDDAGPPLQDEITPEPVWTEAPEQG